MLGEKDVSILGRLRDAVNYSFPQYKIYIAEKLEQVKGKIEPTKDRILGTNTKPNSIER